MTDTGFGRTDRQGPGTFTRPTVDGDRLGSVVLRGGRAVGVDIINFCRTDFGTRARGRHGGAGGVAFWMGLCQMMHVSDRAIGDNLPPDFAAALGRGGERFQGQYGRTFAESEAVAGGVKRPARGRRESL